jgi:EAL domain-containing protein (putative c-di-GMP-specific phosphodiesterase class I)
MNNLTMSINLSAYQFLDPHLIDKLFSALHRNSLQPGDLHLEITEHTMVKDIAETVAVLHQLAKYGFTVSIDDFGTGFSSLAYLKQLPIHTLKLDRSFVTDIPNNSHDMIIVRLVHSLAESLGFQVIAEGVETREQHEFLESLKCDEFQGFLCSRPLPAQKLENFIKEQVLWKSA